MSDFLSPAINERMVEKNMDFDKWIDEMLKPVNDMAVFCHVHNNPYTGPNLKDEIRQLFLDTIEKAKPGKVSNSSERGIGFNLALKEFDRGLKKEIGK